MDRPHLAVVGAGTLGSHLLAQAAPDCDAVTVIDRDAVDQRNLKTSALYGEDTVGQAKAAAAVDALRDQGSGVQAEAQVADLTANTVNLLDAADAVLDATDNLATRQLLNEYCRDQGVPWLHTAALGMRGTVVPITPGDACLRCLYGDVAPAKLASCRTGGIARATARRVARLATGLLPETMDGTAGGRCYRLYDRFSRRLAVSQRDSCQVCGGERPHLDGETGTTTTQLCGADTYHVNPDREKTLSMEEIADSLREQGKVTLREHLLRFDGAAAFTLFRDGRMVVEAGSAAEAKSIYASYIGL